MSETPRVTKAFGGKDETDDGGPECAALADLARTLECELASAWNDSDQAIPEDDAIMAAHPVSSERPDADAIYADALHLVSAKRSKYALVDMVNWLLVSQRLLQEQLHALEVNQCEDKPEAWLVKHELGTDLQAYAHAHLPSVPLYQKRGGA